MQKPFSDNRSMASSAVNFSQRRKQRSAIRTTREQQYRAQRFRRLFVENLEVRWVLNAAYLPPTQFLFSQSGPLTPPAAGAPLDIALSYLQAHAGELGLNSDDLNDPLVTDDYTDADTGLTHIYLRQRVNDLEVDAANFNITVDASGEIVTVGGGFVPGLFDALDSNQQALSPDIGAIDAVTIAAEQLDLSLTPPPEIVAQQDTLDQATSISAAGVSLDDIPARLHYVPTANGSAVLAWELIVRSPSGQDWFDLSVPATSEARDTWGKIISTSNWMENDVYNVVPPPNESPQDGGFSIVTNPADATASPFGWHDTNGIAGPEFTDTRGNNVDAHLDRNSDNVADASPPRPDGGPTLDFTSYVLDPAQAPTVVQNQNVAQVNLFYINNIAHDIHYQYGFTEAAGNFQTNTYGRGGSGNDAVQADAQDGSGTNNANFSSPPDGTQPRMQMYLFNGTPQRDGDLDNGVIIHEYGHGVSNRLTGGPANANALNALQSGGMGEGWSDFYAMMFTQRSTDTQNAAYPQGTYVLNQPPTGNGVRTYPYSYDMSIDPHTWNDFGAVSTEVHYAGEIWTSALWDMNWLLINKYGYDSNLYTGWTASAGPGHAGNKLALKLVMDAMKVQPANPSFTQARDAILAADNALNDGADILEIWTAFARRGLGENASTASSAATSVTTSFTVPAYASSLGIVSTSPAVGSIVPAIPGDYLVNFSYPFLTSSLDASDFQVDGVPADSVDINGPRQATFHFNLAPFSTQGLHTMSMAAGAMLRASDGTPSAAFTGQFRYDLTPLTVTSTLPAAGGVWTLPGPQTFDVNFSEQILPSSVQTSDLVLSGLSGASVSGVTVLAGNTTARFTITGSPATEGTITASIAAGAISDAFGNPGNSFSASYAVDLVTRSYPTPLTSKAPLGSLIYDPSATATINSVGDTDTFTLAVDPNQTITVLVTPSSSGLRPSVQLLDPSNAALGSNTAGLTGQNALLQTITATTSGTYSIVVSGASSTTGAYTVQVILNAALENEGKLPVTNNTLGTAQDLSASFMTLVTSSAAPTRGAVTGQLSYSATAVPFSFTDISTTGTDITTLTNADNSSVSTTIPFTFNFYGTNFTSVFVSSNGLLTFSSSTTSPANATLSTNPSQAAIAPFWDDLRVTNSTSTARVKTQTFGSVGSRQFVIQWDNVTFFSGGSTADPITFQAILNEGTNSIQFNYLDLVSSTAAGNNGASATVGIKAANSANGQFLELANNNGPNTFVGTSKSTLITPTDTDYYSFSLAANETATIAATGLSTGTLNMDLRDAADAVLAAGVTGSTNVTSVISNFTAASSATYYVRVSGNANVNYSLVITKNAAFDTEPNDSTSTPQNVGSLQTILGSVSSNVLFGMNKVGQLFTVNTTTGVGTSVGTPLPFNSTEIEFDNTARRAFAQANDGSFFGQEFNITTGATIGSTITNNASFTGLEWVGATLYGAAFSGPGSSSTLRTLNAFTGTSTTIGSTGFGPLAGLAYDTTTSTMYGITGGTTGTLVTVNLTTGAATTVGATGFRAGSLEFGPDGQLYGGGTGSDEGKIFRINKATGTSTLVGLTGIGATGSRDVTGLTAVFGETDDWYSITVSSLAAFRLETSTPADGANQFVNTLNPHLELIDPSNNVVSGTVLPDGRNETIIYTPSATGTYKIHVTAEGGTSGEYVINRNSNPVLYWDADGIAGNNNTITGAGLGGAGSWDTSSAKWFDGANDIPWPNTNTNAIFMGTAGNVSLAAPIIAGGLTFNTNAYTISSSSSSNTLSLTGGAQINVSSAAFTDTISAPLIGSVGPATTGPGILVLSNSNNIYSGTTTINAGTLRVSALNAIPSASAVTLANVAGATLNLAASDTIASLSGGGTTGGNVTLNSGTTLTVGGANSTTTYAGIISGSNGALTKTGSGTFILTGANTYTGTTTISSGVLQIGNGGSTGTLGTGGVTDNSSLVFNRTVSVSPANVIIGPGTVTIATGQVNLTGNSTYSGTTTINSGASLFLGLSTTGSLNPASAIINNGRFGSQRSNTITQGTDFASIISGTGGITEVSSGGGTLVLNGANTFTGSVLVSAGTIQFTSIQDVGGGPSALGAPTTVANGTISLGTTIATSANLVYIGAGNVTNRVINLAGNSAATVGLAQSGTGLLKFTSNFTSSATAPKTLNLSGSTTGTAEIAGAIVNNSSTNTTSVTKAGSGTWTLSGTSSYTGATTINAGTLIVTGNISTSATTVANTATLAGTGTTDGVTVNSGGTLAPGSSPGILHTGDVNLGSGAVYTIELNGTVAGSDYDQVSATGSVTINNATLNANVGFAPSGGESFTIIDNTGAGAVSGNFNNLPEGSVFTLAGAPAGATFQITYVGGTGNDVVITYIQTPSVTPPADQQASEGVLTAIDLGSFSDLDGAPWTVDVNWGDGSPDTILTSSSGSIGQQNHTYANEGVNLVTITVTDSTNLSGTASFNVNVLDVAPQVAADSAAVSAPENTLATNSGTFSDYDEAVTITTSSGTVSQSGTQAGTWSWSGTGVEDSPYSVTITATNADGSTATTSFAVAFSGSKLYWDADGIAGNNNISTGAGLGGTGDWDTSSAKWFDGVNDITWPNSSSPAFFRGAAGTVTLTTPITAGSLKFDTTGYVISSSISTNALTLAGPAEVNVSSSTLTDTISSKITGSSSLTTIGPGTLVLSNSSNDYTGPTNINAGTLQVGTSNSIPSSSAVSINTGATLDLNSQSDSIGSLAGTAVVVSVTIGGGGGAGSGYITPPTVTFSGGGGSGATGTANISGGSVTSVTVTNAGHGYTSSPTITFSAPPSGTTANAFSVIAGGSLLLGGATLTTGNNNTSTVFAGIISGSGQLVKVGTGSQSLNANNLYSGGTTITSGTLISTNSGFFSGTLGTGPVTDNAALTINANGFQSIFSNAISGPGSVTASGSTVNLTAINTYTGTTLVSGLLFLGQGSTKGALSPLSSITDNGTFGAQFNGTTTQGTDFANVISGTGRISSSVGTMVLNGLNLYTGTSAVGSGTLSFNSIQNVGGGASALGAPTTVPNGTIALGSTTTTGTLLYSGTGNTTDRVVNLAGTTGGGTITQSGTGLLKFTSNFTATGAGSKTLTLQGNTSGTGEIAGAIVNNSASNVTRVTKSGTGTWTLSGTSTYTGPTTISGGKLIVTGNIATSATTVTSGGTLGGTGTTDGVTINSGGTLSPGSGPGILHTGNISLGSGAIFAAELNGAVVGSGYDQVSTGGSVTITGATLNATVGFSSSVGDRFTIIDKTGTGAVSGSFNGLPEGTVFTPAGAPAGDHYQITYVGGTGNDVVITHIQAPSVAPPADQQAIEGVLTAFSLGSFSDPDGNPWTVDVSWGDATPDTIFVTGSSGSIDPQSHTYVDEGVKAVVVTVTDATNLSRTASFNINVIDAAPHVAANSSAVSALEDASAANSGTFSDYDDSVIITASSGTVTQSGTQAGTWSWTGTGDDNAPYTVTITATNADGSTATTSFGVSFTDIAPTVSVDSPHVSAPENASAANSGAFSDFDDAVTITASSGMVTQSGSQAGTWAWSGTGDEDAPYTVTITATNADGSTATTSFAVSFTDVAPTVAADNAAVSAAENAPAANTGTWSDYDDAVTLSASDGTITQNADGTWSWSNTYDDDGTHTIIVTAQNANGSIATTSFLVNVTNVAPTLTISGAGSVAEASSYTLHLSSFDPGADTINHWTIDWGDGAPELISGNPASAIHTYADGNATSAYTISATATDEDGTFAAGNTVAVTVNNVSPAVSIAGPASGIPLADLTFTLSPTDPSAIDQAAGFTYSIDWGDGSPIQTSSTPSVSHAYASVGSKSIAITAIDKDNGASATATHSVSIVYALPQGDNLLVGGTSAADTIVITPVPGGQVQVAMNSDIVGTFAVSGQIQVANLGTTTDTLNVEGTAANDTINKSGTIITLGSPVYETVAYSGSFSVFIRAYAGNDYVQDPGGDTTILGGSGDDTIIIDGSTGSGVVVDGGEGSDTYIIQAGPELQAPVTISDSGATGVDSVLLSGTAGDDSITQTNSGFNLDGAPINIGTGLEAATIDGGGGSDEVVASGTPPVPVQIQGVADMVITGTAGDDQITFTPGNVAGQIVGTLNNVVVSRFSPTGRVIAYGGDGNDNIQVAGTINLPAWLYGEAGNDRLNAGNGGSLEIGGDGDDQLIGGNGRDVMIGGDGADQLVGNSEDDILVGGLTIYDSRSSAGHEEFWRDILHEWNSTNLFSVRVQNLRNGTGGNRHNGDSFLLPSVRDDLAPDAVDFLNGTAGNDWLIFLMTEDKVTNGEATDNA